METDSQPISLHQCAGGEKRVWSIATLICAFVGALASGGLFVTEIHHDTDPTQALACDVNPLIGCGVSLGSQQGHLFFGLPNSLIGLIGFSALCGIALVLLAKRRLARWVWWLMAIGSGAAMVWVIWFLYQSVVVFRTLCPYCLVVWAVTIPLVTLIWSHMGKTAYANSEGILQRPYSGARAIAVQVRWLIAILVYVLILAVIIVGLSDKLLLVVGG